MSTAGNYPIDHRAGEIERLHRQGAAMAPDCEIMLDKIGVGDGWRCLDLGCGPEGITALLSARVGKTGKVVGLDADPGFLDHARRRAAAHTEFVLGNAYGSALASGGFDLVHLRFVASTAGDPQNLLREATGWRGRAAPSYCKNQIWRRSTAIRRIRLGTSSKPR
jgi:SAM-dependent methyltransferase